jgi:spore coat protein JA
MNTFRKTYKPFISPLDPCPPIKVRTFETPPQLYMGFQPYNLPQFPNLKSALKHGTLWPALFAPYDSPFRKGGD